MYNVNCYNNNNKKKKKKKKNIALIVLLGKSTFINCLRGVQDVEYTEAFVHTKIGPAPTGINETTQVPTHYCWPHDEYPALSIWDLPGGNTQKHPAETYFEDKALYAFDCLLLLKSGRFTELDGAIYKKAIQFKIPVAIVLTKADIDIKNRAKLRASQQGSKLREDQMKKLIEETTQILKNNVRDEIVALGCPAPSLECMFVICSQSYRDEKQGILEVTDCPPLETEKLFIACCNIAVYRRITL